MQPEENKSPKIERRRFPRFKAVVIEYSLENRDSAREVCFSRDISVKGVSIIVNEEVKPGAAIGLLVYLPYNSEPIRARGRVVWSQESPFKLPHRKHYDLGIEFTEISEDDRNKISELSSTTP